MNTKQRWQELNKMCIQYKLKQTNKTLLLYFAARKNIFSHKVVHSIAPAISSLCLWLPTSLNPPKHHAEVELTRK